jgi:hypothetical protein
MNMTFDPAIVNNAFTGLAPYPLLPPAAGPLNAAIVGSDHGWRSRGSHGGAMAIEVVPCNVLPVDAPYTAASARPPLRTRITACDQSAPSRSGNLETARLLTRSMQRVNAPANAGLFHPVTMLCLEQPNFPAIECLHDACTRSRYVLSRAQTPSQEAKMLAVHDMRGAMTALTFRPTVAYPNPAGGFRRLHVELMQVETTQTPGHNAGRPRLRHSGKAFGADDCYMACHHAMYGARSIAGPGVAAVRLALPALDLNTATTNLADMIRDFDGLVYWCEHNDTLALTLLGLQIRDVRAAATVVGGPGGAAATVQANAAATTYPGAALAIAGF